jgi:hypothetical protein
MCFDIKASVKKTNINFNDLTDQFLNWELSK